MTYDSPIFGVLFPFPPGEDFRLRGTGQIGGCRNRVHGGGGAGRPPRGPSTSGAAGCAAGESIRSYTSKSAKEGWIDRSRFFNAEMFSGSRTHGDIGFPRSGRLNG